MESDFDRTYPKKKKILLSKWPPIAKIIIKLAAEHDKNVDVQNFLKENQKFLTEGKILVNFFLFYSKK